MAVFAAKLEPGFTLEQYRAALLNVCTQAWGAPTYKQPAAGYWAGFRTFEWPDFHGRKHYWFHSTTTSVAPNIASHEAAGGYKNPIATVAFPSDPANKTVVTYLMALSGPDYRAFSIVNSVIHTSHVVGQFRYPSVWWGASDRVYIANNFVEIFTIPGLNPFGKLDASGNAAPAGRTNYPLDLRTVTYGVNTITGLREVRKHDHFADSPNGIVGFVPDDLGVAASQSIPASAPVMYDAGADRLYLSLNTGGTATWCVKVPSAPFTGLTTYPASVYDLAKPTGSPGGETVTIIEPHPARQKLSGEIFFYGSPHLEGDFS